MAAMWTILSLCIGVLVTAAALLMLRRVVLVVDVHGISMEPTLHHGDRVLAVRRGLWHRPKLGDVAVCLPPPVPGERPVGPQPTHGPPVVKRIVGLGGDEILTGGDRRVVPAGQVWIRGDGRFSHDSDNYGPLRSVDVLAVVVARLPAARPVTQ